MGEVLTQNDISSISSKGIDKQSLLNQLRQFQEGFNPLPLVSAATLADGISNIDDEIDTYIKYFNEATASCLKFVPASGAASRMFKKLFEFRTESKKKEETYRKMLKEKGFIYTFFKHLNSFSFYKDLETAFQKAKGYSLQEAQDNQDFDEILDVFLTDIGLNYGNLPKGLLKFHNYDGETKTPAQEHLTEGLSYSNKGSKVRIHFTVSPEHLAGFQSHINSFIENTSTEFEIKFSTQKPKTDTIAVHMDNSPFRMENGELLFRPAGHGALLENLNELDADVIFIKNIDNVVPDRLKEETIKYKKALAGLLLSYQARAFSLLQRNDLGENIKEEGIKILEEMGFKGQLSQAEIVTKLNRPIRVCGMVKNEGEPGGGPFWIKEDSGMSLQIVESAQIDMNEKKQVDIFKESTHFNPVDLVCGIKNYKGEKFDLLNFRDMEAGFISEKSRNGKKLKAMELPGLWNGSMSDWNTIFVEVPLITFNPVKTVNDLLKENHR